MELRCPGGEELRALYAAAFPDEDLTGLVAALAADPAVRHVCDGALEAHAALTPCRVGDAPVWLLGPVAVAPERQGRGRGRVLVTAALAAVRPDPVCVLGDPGFYGRFGFTREDAVAPPYALPEEWAPAWQAIRTGALSGKLRVPAVWRDSALWR
ncbi:GNAT family N-acetyltransferase [Jannaschia ovalis]|uniref:GNAT family N-acetyltransferase n=1 Tax=Jannaschia ovalis TaxID=3038773 RepID=A0ABY8LFC8_9RHOB|nr:GNAT family N-acetyltransferase [Jannaschia sp. GRR-S6-38]WGH78869.1 GNAT family N-acetyltransferase [Jannaschia sp. GRR-S6-38]